MSGSSQDPSPPAYAVSKNIIVSKSTWMRLYLPTTALNGGVASKKLPLVVYFHGGGYLSYNVDSPVFNAGCNLIASATHRPVPKNKLPLVVYFHGGGFTSRSFIESETFKNVCKDIAHENNVVVASPSHQLAPQRDGVEAVEWIKNNSEEDEWLKSYADLSNVFLMGIGTSGSVAYNVGLRITEKDLTPLSIRGLILLSPFFGVDVTVGAGPDNLEKIKRLGWKVMVTGVRGDPLVDRQRDVVERFTDVNDRDKFASITSFIYSSAP